MDIASVEFWVARSRSSSTTCFWSGDNAIVIALACRNLPPNQRRWGVIWGALAAVLLPVADWVKAQGPWLQWAAAAAGILVVIGPRLLAQAAPQRYRESRRRPVA